MDKTQKKNLLILAVLGAVYFILFIFPNASTLGSDNPQVYLHKDEYVIYPVVERMLLLEGSFSNIWGRLIIYGDYTYGYPFYFLSSLALLPLRLINGEKFFSQLPLNILILRQAINILPIILTAGIFSYLQTKFRSTWKSIFVFLFLLTIPAVVRSNIHWWHPDSLMLLAIALTFLFLDLDKMRLGKNFYLAAAACGLAAGIKLSGFFFVLAIPFYLLICCIKSGHPLKKIILAGVGFVLVMALAILLSNPFLFYEVPRQEMLARQGEKAGELASGYAHEESLYFRTAPRYWRWTLRQWYGRPWMIDLLYAALLFGSVWGDKKTANQLITAWTIPLGVYLLWFVAPKPDHYLLPLLIPVYSAVLTPVPAILEDASKFSGLRRVFAFLRGAIYAGLIGFQLYFHLSRSIEHFMSFIFL